MQDVHGVPASEQLLTANGRLLSNAASTLAAAGLQNNSSITLLMRLCGGKGGFGALLRGQGRDGKITDNFDAMRDLSGRRIRHVEAEKKLQEWKQDAKERELEVIAMRHMKEMAKQAKADRDFQVGHRVVWSAVAMSWCVLWGACYGCRPRSRADMCGLRAHCEGHGVWVGVHGAHQVSLGICSIVRCRRIWASLRASIRSSEAVAAVSTA